MYLKGDPAILSLTGSRFTNFNEVGLMPINETGSGSTSHLVMETCLHVTGRSIGFCQPDKMVGRRENPRKKSSGQKRD